MRRLREEQQDLRQALRAPATRKAYSTAWGIFERWCVDAGRQALPASVDTVGLYLAHRLSDRETRIATCEMALSAIASTHRDAGFDPPARKGSREAEELRTLINGARRKRRERPGGKAALSVEELTAMLRACREREGKSLLGLRDRALLLVGFASGMRRSELVGLDIGDVKPAPKGVALYIGRSKTDQIGSGRWVGLHRSKRGELCPVRALAAWQKARGDDPGPLFCRVLFLGRPDSGKGQDLRLERLSGNAVAAVVRRWAVEIGLDAERYGAHSLRAGLVTAAIAGGASELATMQRTGHKSVGVLKRYVRPASAFAIDPLAGVL